MESLKLLNEMAKTDYQENILYVVAGSITKNFLKNFLVGTARR